MLDRMTDLRFKDSTETETLRISQAGRGGSFAVVREGKLAAWLGTGIGGEKPSFSLGDKFIAALDDHGLPTLELYDNNDRRAILSADDTGPGLRLLHSNGKAAVALGISDHLPVLGLVDDRGNILFHEPE
jgi:hypothetical protein